MKNLVLVSCSGPKLERSAFPTRAGEAYTSDLFQKSKTWALNNGDEWAILSAKYGLVWPWDFIDHYDLELAKQPVAYRRAWAARVAEQLRPLAPGRQLTVLAGKHYVAFAKHLPDAAVVDLLKGMQVGERLSWLKQANAQRSSVRV